MKKTWEGHDFTRAHKATFGFWVAQRFSAADNCCIQSPERSPDREEYFRNAANCDAQPDSL
jgi:hypothetical protein